MSPRVNLLNVDTQQEISSSQKGSRQVLTQVNKMLSRAETLICSLLMAFASGVLFINIILRYFFNKGFVWAEEVIIFSMIWVTFFGSAICVRRKTHVAMRFLVGKIDDANARNVYECGLLLLSIIFSVVILVLSTKQVLYLVTSQQVSSALRLPMFIPYVAIPVGFLFMLLGFLEELYQRLTGNYQGT